MAKHAILSDVHANLEAFTAVYRDLASLGDVRSLVSLGDLVGYGPNPTEVISALAALAKKGLSVRYCMGNHDAAAVGRFEFVDFRDPSDASLLAQAGLKDFQAVARQYEDQARRKYIPVSPNARASNLWTRQRLAEPFRQFILQNSKDHLFLADGVLCVHASPRDPLFEYVLTARRAQKGLEAPLMKGVALCLVGHTHIPGIWQLPADQLVRFAGNVICMQPPFPVKGTSVRVEPGAKITIVNVGGVGQPRDGDPRACYAVYDDAAQTVELRRVAYDVAATRQKLLASGLPANLADKLGTADAEAGIAQPTPEEE